MGTVTRSGVQRKAQAPGSCCRPVLLRDAEDRLAVKAGDGCGKLHVGRPDGRSAIFCAGDEAVALGAEEAEGLDDFDGFAKHVELLSFSGKAAPSGDADAILG